MSIVSEVLRSYICRIEGILQGLYHHHNHHHRRRQHHHHHPHHRHHLSEVLRSYICHIEGVLQGLVDEGRWVVPSKTFLMMMIILTMMRIITTICITIISNTIIIIIIIIILIWFWRYLEQEGLCKNFLWTQPTRCQLLLHRCQNLENKKFSFEKNIFPLPFREAVKKKNYSCCFWATFTVGGMPDSEGHSMRQPYTLDLQ